MVVEVETKAARLGARAAMVVVPSGKPPSVVPRKKVVFHYVKTLGVGAGPQTACA